MFHKLFKLKPHVVNVFCCSGKKNGGYNKPADDVSAVNRRVTGAPGDILSPADAAVCQLLAHGHVHAAQATHCFGWYLERQLADLLTFEQHETCH